MKHKINRAVIRLAACFAVLLAASGTADPLYFPAVTSAQGQNWDKVDPAQIGWDRQALGSALDFAREQRTSGIVILLGGKIAVEAYWEPAQQSASRWSTMVAARTEDGRTIEDVASVQKSIVSFLAGVARGKGLLDFDAPVTTYLGKGWSHATQAQEARITVKHLLSMTSGLDRKLKYSAPAGTKWAYNSAAYSQLIRVLEQASGLAVHDYTREWLTNPIGMSETRWGPRPWIPAGVDAAPIGLQTSARDLAKFGLLMQARGHWAGRDVIGDGDYMDEALRRSQAFNPNYGLLWWLSTADSLPADLYSARGALGRFIMIAPGANLVIARMGDAPGQNFMQKFWTRLRKAVP